jgi:hypothetical protein
VLDLAPPWVLTWSSVCVSVCSFLLSMGQESCWIRAQPTDLIYLNYLFKSLISNCSHIPRCRGLGTLPSPSQPPGQLIVCGATIEKSGSPFLERGWPLKDKGAALLSLFQKPQLLPLLVWRKNPTFPGL